MKKYYFSLVILLSALLAAAKLTLAGQSLAPKLSGRILLQAESRGEAWYINPADQKKYFLGRPADAFSIMQSLGIGITDDNLEKFPVGLISYDDADNDDDGLANRLENALGTDPENSDSDNDGYPDLTEIINNYRPLGAGKINLVASFISQNQGKIFLQTEKRGEAWYISPADSRRYFLSRPADAFLIMKNFSLGISNENISQIATGRLADSPPDPEPPACSSCQKNYEEAEQIFTAAANAVRQGRTGELSLYFSPEIEKAVAYTVNFLDAEGRLLLSNIMSGAEIKSADEDEIIYQNEIYFSLGGYKILISYVLKKQADGTWKIINI